MVIHRFLALVIAFVLPQAALPGSALAGASGVVDGPVRATVVTVIDGDTFVADAHVWPGHTIRVSVRVRGIDAPELRGRCEAERRAGEEARDALVRLLGDEAALITNIGGGKFFGRVLADVTAPGGRPVAEAMLADGHARPYSGGARVAFCGAGETTAAIR